MTPRNPIHTTAVRAFARQLLVVPLLGLAGCATVEPGNERVADPLEPVNRVVFFVNDKADMFVIRPAGQAYNFVLPQPVRTGIGNFFDNATYPVTIVNGFLQGKFSQGSRDTARFLINSTVGLLGFFDPATGWGFEEHAEDFGLTFARWGVPSGPYVVLPLLGPHTLRSAVGLAGNVQVNPLLQLNDSSIRSKLVILWFVESRAALIGPDESMQEAYDPYLFMRDAYLQNRLYRLRESKGDAPAGEDGFDDGFEDF